MLIATLIRQLMLERDLGPLGSPLGGCPVCRSKIACRAQKYVAHDCDTSEMGSSRFAVADVHRIGILDLRLFNTDRHAGNILVRRPRASGANLGALARLDEAQLSLVPIDHGFCLPEALEPPYLEWQHWPQARVPCSALDLERRVLAGCLWRMLPAAGRSLVLDMCARF